MARPGDGPAPVPPKGPLPGRRRGARSGLRCALLSLALGAAHCSAPETAPETAPATRRALTAEAADAHRRGAYAEGASASERALALARAELGPRHRDTLAAMNNLAALRRAQGRHGEAEALFAEALRLRRAGFGLRHPGTLNAMNNLADLYRAQGRHGEAEPLLREALPLARAELGPRHPSTFSVMNNLAVLRRAQGRHGEAEALFAEALPTMREALGPGHPDTLAAANNLALLYAAQGRHGEAEALLTEALPPMREALGPLHPSTLAASNNLADLHRARGRYGDAEALYREALEGARAALGPAHPTTLLLQLGRASNLAALGRAADAVRQLRAMEEPVLARIGAELLTSEAARARRLVASQADYQHVALSLALLPGAGPDAAGLAASAVLRLKGVQAEEEARLARLARAGQDPRAREIAAELATRRRLLTALFQNPGERAEEEAVAARLQERELALARVSREYDRHLRVRGFDLANLRAALAGLPRRAALLELREYRRVDFRSGALEAPRWAGVLVRADGARVVDLGPVAGTAEAAQALLAGAEGEAERRAARALHDRLLGPLAAELAGLEGLHVAPDGDLHLLPFAALLGPDGRRLAERLDLGLLQTGRDLLRPGPDEPRRGLLALGGVDFDDAPPAQPAGTPGPPSVGATEPGIGAAMAALATGFAPGFAPLPASAGEVRAVASLYRLARPGEPVEVWEGPGASEARLRTRGPPPRVLHLATHGFYRASSAPLDRPMLLSAVALAGANRALREPGRDGVLHAIEAQDLDLEGTELVVLSACETAQGQIDYGEGVSGLVRALRTAGARYALVTLRKVSDEGAADLMVRFYRHWLAQAKSDPAAAFRAAQREAMAAPPADSAARRDRTWAHFVLVGG